MAIDWMSLVVESIDDLAKKPMNIDLFPQKVGTDQGEVGTKFDFYAVDKKEVLKPVPAVPTVPTTFDRARDETVENSIPSAFKYPAGGGVSGESAPHKTGPQTSCFLCDHLRHPGLTYGYCCKREDLPPAYGSQSTLRQLPKDDGQSCQLWVLNPAMCGADTSEVPDSWRRPVESQSAGASFAIPVWRRRR